MKPTTINTTSEAKEFTLSLFRIPLNFFSEENSQNNNDKNKSSHHIETVESEEIISSTSSEENNPLEKNPKVDISFSQDMNLSGKKTSTQKPATSPSQTSELEPPQLSPQAIDVTPTKPTPPPPQTTKTSNQPQQNIGQQVPTSMPKESPTTSTQENAPESPLPPPHQDKPNNTNTEDANKDSEIPESSEKTWGNSNDTTPPSSASASKKDDSSTPKQKKADDFTYKFGKKSPISEKDSKARNKNIEKAKEKLSKSPAGRKALGGLSKAAEVKDKIDTTKKALENSDPEKADEALGDLAAEGVTQAAQAFVRAYVGEPGAKAVETGAKTVGQTKTAKTVKKATGRGIRYCTTCGCLAIPLLVIIVVFVFAQSIGWITNLFGKNNSVYTQLTEEDYQLLKQASLEYSMQDYTDLTTQLNNPAFLQSIFGLASKFPIQEALEKYLNEYYTYDQTLANEHNTKYAHLIEKGYVMKIYEGNLTSFGMAFELIKENYSIVNLKKPSSAPKREKEIVGQNGETITYTYTTYDPTGIHQALFQDVLTNIEGLKNRFNGQVDKVWFDELVTILDTKHPVYIQELSETRQISLRDLFIETSYNINDAEYSVNLVKKILTDGNNNADIIAQYKILVEKLSMLELMTYMLDYQQYYSQVNEIKDFAANAKNAELFDTDSTQNGGFWNQFLTFTNVEHYLALSSATEHSLAYEIAVASYESSTNSIKVSKLPSNFVGLRQLSNWYATYYFEPEVFINGNDEYTYMMNCTKVEPTAIRNRLFDKYNVYYGLYDKSNLAPEEKARKNEEAFFAIFETATGIEMGEMQPDGSQQMPIYKKDPNSLLLTKSFPISSEPGITARITKGYGQLYSDSTVVQLGLTHSDHTGIDYAVPSGTPIVATTSGTAYVTRGNTGYGNYVKIIHDDGYVSFYAHGNGTFYVNNGSRVTAGQPIMQSGNSGNSTGPHLHWEIRNPNGTTINPTSYIYGNA